MFNYGKISPYCFRKFNQFRKFVGLKPLRDYKLLTKTDRLDISHINKNKMWQVPADAESFCYVEIGKKSDPNFSSEVIAFYNQDGNIVSKCFRENGLNKALRCYKKLKNKRIVERYTFDTSRMDETIKAKFLINYGGLWKKISDEFQITGKVLGESVGGKSTLFLNIKKIIYGDGQSRHFSFTEYPINFGNGKKTSKKELAGTIIGKGKDLQLHDVKKSSTLDIDTDDEFMIYRFLDPRTEEGTIALTQKFLKDKGLEVFDIAVRPNSPRLTSTRIGLFSSEGREICYAKKLYNMCIERIVEIFGHESDHALQHCMIGRIGKGKTKYETEALQVLGPLEKPSEIEEAVKYAIAESKYPKISEGENLSENIDYIQNYLEEAADNAGIIASERFTKNRKNFEFFEKFA